MIWFKDVFGRNVRLTDERREHLETAHPEMAGQLDKVAKTLEAPQTVVKSSTDTGAELYYRFYSLTALGDKYLCVVVKVKAEDAFILTVYFTDSIKKGDIIWPAR